MTTISSTTSSTTSSMSRISGLVSGLDTDALVKNMCASTQSKIDTLKQKKQLLTWKQEDYRTITKSLTKFKTDYFQSYSSDSVLNAGFWKNLSVTSSASEYITATANADAPVGTVKISDITSLATAATLESSAAVTQSLDIDVDTASLSSLAGKSIKLTLDGITKELEFSDQTYSDASAVQTELQSLIDDAFGSERITVDISGDTLSLTAEGSTAAINYATDNDASSILNFTNGQSNRLDLTSSLSGLSLATTLSDTIQFEINGVNFEFAKSDSMSDVIKKINSSDAGVKLSYSNITDKFTLTATSTGTGNTIVRSDGTGSNFLTAILGTGSFQEGTNAKLNINGATVTRSSNTFTIDGVTYNVLGKADDDADDTAENVSLTVGLNVDKIVEGVQKFVDDYNALLKEINDKTGEKRDYDYDPLTDAQKEEMSEDEITAWQEKARTGLLHSDSTLQQIVTEMRTSLFTDVKDTSDGSSIGVYLNQLGITTGSYETGGKLTLDEDTLRSALAENPDGIAQLFTQESSIESSSSLTSAEKSQRYSEQGIGWRLYDILNENVRTTRDTAGNKGKLLELAGITDDVSEYNNSIYTQIKTINDNIDTTEDRLTTEEDRYYAKFTAMETALQTLNTQSSWLSSMLGSDS